jgi:Spy/CpxP family protein refolding chaperone
MKLTRFVVMAGMVGMLAAPAAVYAHCGTCGVGDAKHGKKGMEGHDPVAMMTQELGLTADQQAKMKAIKEDMHTQMEALHQATHAKVKAILTPEQQAKHDKMPNMCDMCKHPKGDKHGADRKH